MNASHTGDEAEFLKKLDESVDDSVVECMLALHTCVVHHQGAPLVGCTIASLEAYDCVGNDGFPAMDDIDDNDHVEKKWLMAMQSQVCTALTSAIFFHSKSRVKQLRK